MRTWWEMNDRLELESLPRVRGVVFGCICKHAEPEFVIWEREM